jgi:hypothetical protein
MIEIIIRLILLLIQFFLTATVPTQDSPVPSTGIQPPAMVIENVRVDVSELPSFAQISLHVTGYQPDGCEAPVEVTQRQNANVIAVQITRNLPPDVLCPANIVPYEADIPLDGQFANGTYTIDVNGLQTTVTVGSGAAPAVPAQGASMSHTLTIVEKVDTLLLESFPVQISLHVTGYQPDGCDYPVQVTQNRSGNTVTVEIFRELPPDIMCPMMLVGYDQNIKLDGSFESGTYSIIVNGVSTTVTI